MVSITGIVFRGKNPALFFFYVGVCIDVCVDVCART